MSVDDPLRDEPADARQTPRAASVVYVYHKMGVPFRQMHSWDYSGPYHGVEGFAVFARDMDTTISSPSWDLFTPPWQAPRPAPALVGIGTGSDD